MIEEKQTDVNIALQAYRDAAQGICDQVVICSNDSDLEPALRLIREDAPAATIGLIMSLRAQSQGDGKVPNKRLTPLAHWVRHHILDEELLHSQLPQTVPTKKKPAGKPLHWWVLQTVLVRTWSLALAKTGAHISIAARARVYWLAG